MNEDLKKLLIISGVVLTASYLLFGKKGLMVAIAIPFLFP